MKEKKQISSLGIETLYAGVEAVFLSRNAFVCNVTICKKRKGALEIERQEQHLDMAATRTALKNISHIYLLITGKPVIYKKLSKFHENSQELTGILLPDAKQSEFVSQCTEANGSFYGAVIRRDVLQEVLKPFCAARLFPQTITMGPAVLSALPSVVEEEKTFSTSAYDATVEGKSVTFINNNQPQAETIRIGQDEVNTLNLPGLCLCLQAQTQYPFIGFIEDTEAKKATSEAVQKRKFKKIAAILVLILFLLTGGNFFFNRAYSKSHAELEEQLALNRQMLNEIEKLEKDIGEKRSLLGNRPGSNGPVISLIGDRLAATVPSKIKLQNLEIFPLEGKIAREKPIGFTFSKVIVEGISNESDVLDQWIDQCKKFDWVKDVLIVKYTFDHEKKRGWFKLELLLQ